MRQLIVAGTPASVRNVSKSAPVVIAVEQLGGALVVAAARTLARRPALRSLASSSRVMLREQLGGDLAAVVELAAGCVIHCQTCAREISAVAASSIRL